MENNNQLAVIGGNLFGSIDFNQLNNAITKLGESSSQLSAQEKESGTIVIKEWEETVIHKLRKRAAEMRSIESFFKSGMYFEPFNEEQLLSIAAQTNTLDIYNEIIELKEEINKLELEEKPMRPQHSDFISIIENELNFKKFELEDMKYNNKIKKLREEQIKYATEWKKKLKKHPLMKEMLQKSKTYTENYDDMVENCKNKSKMARLNIAIGNDEIRESLKELLDFTNIF